MNQQQTGIKRVNPRRPVHVNAQGLRRIVLGEQGADGAVWQRNGADAHAVAAAKPVRSPGPFARRYMVITQSERGHLSDHAREVLAAAAILAAVDTEVVLVVLGECSDDAGALGADSVVSATDFQAASWQPQAVVHWLQQCVATYAPVRIMMADNEQDGGLGRRLAARLAWTLQGRVVGLSPEQVRQRADAQTDRLSPAAQVLLLNRSVAVAELPFVGLNQIQAAPAWSTQAVDGITDLGVARGEAHSVALTEADFILAAGNGVTDVPLFQQVAAALGAATAASRVAVDAGLFPRERQVGATGKTVQASVYIAVGISGAVQHLQGIKDCRRVVAVNLDEAAPIMQRADVAVVADAQAWLAALLREIEARQNPSAGGTP